MNARVKSARSPHPSDSETACVHAPAAQAPHPVARREYGLSGETTAWLQPGGCWRR
ncbi:hypothetical protein CBM2585_B50348 [Cupriavidus taiwanensis]|nr:hypothetical protein CBM2585_B50348 [Cupriavidus taiwanensis]